MVSPVPQSAGSRGANGGAGSGGRSHNHLEMGASLWSGGIPALERRSEAGSSSTWHVDETFVRIAGRWMYLFRAVDGGGQTGATRPSETRDREAAKLFLKRALGNPDNRPPHVFARDGLRSYPAAIRELQGEGQLHRCRQRTRRYCNNRIEIRSPSYQAAPASHTGTTDESDDMDSHSRD